MLNFSFLLLLISFVPHSMQNKPDAMYTVATTQTTFYKEEHKLNNAEVNTATDIDDNIRSIFQDSKGFYWFGTNGSGIYCYDLSLGTSNEKSFIQFTEKDGLSNNQVLSIQEDDSGNMWFGTGQFGVSRFDGRTFTTMTNNENLNLSSNAVQDWNIAPHDMWFYAGGGVLHYNFNALTYLPLAETVDDAKNSKNSPFNLSRYAVYSILKDTKGNLWFGTQAQGVCRYDGTSFTWFIEDGLLGPAVLGLFEDRKGNIWIGNNGSGLFRYDGKTMINFTEEKGLSNKEFRISGKAGPGTLGRIYCINEDNIGNLWIGTVDAGVWRYDGNHLKNYTARDGLISVAVNTIYKDKKGELWFGTDEDGVYKFNGITFTKFVVK